jgi:hypothetical protein
MTRWRLLWLLWLLATPSARAGDEPSQLRAVVGAGASQGTALNGPWAPRTSYNASLYGLWEAGQGGGARLSLLPPAHATEGWGLSTDLMARLTGQGPLYLKLLGGASVSSRALASPGLRVGLETGVHAIRGPVGLELGLSGVYSFPPAHFTQGQAVVSLGVSVLLGFRSSSVSLARAPPESVDTPVFNPAADFSRLGRNGPAGPSAEWEALYCKALSSPSVPEALRVVSAAHLAAAAPSPSLKPAPGPEPLFAWVHLSDIHWGHGGADYQANQRLVFSALEHLHRAWQPRRVTRGGQGARHRPAGAEPP